MLKLDLSEYHQYLKMTAIGKKRFIYDPIRKSDFVIQPEELVRQSWIQFLVREMGVPMSVMSVERQLKLNTLKKRFDMVIYKKAIPNVLFEFKSFNQPINEDVTQQISNYNLTLKVPYLILSNGLDHFAFKVDFENSTTTALDNLDFLTDL